MTEMQTVIGRIQLQRMPAWTEARQRNTQAITDACSEFELIRTWNYPVTWHMHAINITALLDQKSSKTVGHEIVSCQR